MGFYSGLKSLTRIRLNRMELAGSLGDLGTLLPISIAMVLFNGVDPVGVFFSIAVYYIVAGLYFGMTVPVQPMKAIAAYAIATNMSAEQVLASTLLMGILLSVIGISNAVEPIRKYTPKAVIRGVQLSTGAMLIASGVKYVIGTSYIQVMHKAVEPFLAIQSIGPVPISLVLGIVGGLITLLLLHNKRFPAVLVVLPVGLLIGITIGVNHWSGEWFPAINIPKIMPKGFPGTIDFTFALFALVLPQLPMTLGNAVLSYTDLAYKYFGEQAGPLTNRTACLSMGLANLFSFVLGGIPLCHGAGGLAAHYSFGARTAGSNLFIGLVILLLVLLFGSHIMEILELFPLSLLGVLLAFAGVQLALSIMDLGNRKDYFVAMLIFGITIASNLAIGFIVGLVISWLLRWEKLSV